MQKPSRREHDWPDIPQQELIGRLFPLAGASKIPLEGMIPGCYWEPWKIPIDKTALDEAIETDIIKKYGFESSDKRLKIKEAGLICPYYAWRAHTAIAAIHAFAARRDINPIRRTAISAEIDNWQYRIDRSNALIRQNIEYSLPSGSPHLVFDCMDDDAVQEMYDLRKQRFAALHEEIENDKKIVLGLEKEIARIDQAMDGKTGNQIPDYWKRPFFIYLSNLWSTFSGSEVPFHNEDIWRILTAATFVISGGTKSIKTWSLTKTLKNEVFKDNLPEQGFRLGEVDFFDLDNDASFYRRGQAMVDLNEIFENDYENDPETSALAFGAIWLRDYCDGDLATIVRETLLRRGMAGRTILPPRAALQLGWLAPTPHEEIREALRRSVAKARQGDLAAAFVLEVACAFNDVREIVEVAGWQEPFGGHRQRDFERELATRDEITPDHRLQDGDHKAFRVVMAFAGISVRPFSTMQGRSMPARFG